MRSEATHPSTNSTALPVTGTSHRLSLSHRRPPIAVLIALCPLASPSSRRLACPPTIWRLRTDTWCGGSRWRFAPIVPREEEPVLFCRAKLD